MSSRPMTVKEQILRQHKVVAVVGLSPKEERPSHQVSGYMKGQGYKIIPVNPQVEEVLGEKSYPDLASIPEPVDCVDIFRRSEEVGPIVDAAISIGAKSIWMQDGVEDLAAARRAEAAGLLVVTDD